METVNIKINGVSYEVAAGSIWKPLTAWALRSPLCAI